MCAYIRYIPIYDILFLNNTCHKFNFGRILCCQQFSIALDWKKVQILLCATAIFASESFKMIFGHYPGTKLIAPSGNPASYISSDNIKAENWVCSAVSWRMCNNLQQDLLFVVKKYSGIIKIILVEEIVIFNKKNI